MNPVDQALARYDAQMPEVPQTADALAVRWAERDAEYAKARVSMTDEAAEAIRMMRMREANHLPRVGERGRMFARAKGWVPPVHPDFGGMRDWL
jgi:hypothetical protein